MSKDDDKVINDADSLLEEAAALSKKADGALKEFDSAIGEIESENAGAESGLDQEILEIIKSMEVVTDEFENDLGTNE